MPVMGTVSNRLSKNRALVRYFAPTPIGPVMFCFDDLTVPFRLIGGFSDAIKHVLKPRLDIQSVSNLNHWSPQ